MHYVKNESFHNDNILIFRSRRMWYIFHQEKMF